MTISEVNRPLLFVAVDIGNARIKLGLFAEGGLAELLEPSETLTLWGDAPELDQIASWLANHAGKRLPWWIASVNRPAATRLIDWLYEHRPDDRVTLLAAGDLPLDVRLDRPDMVGIDRLVDAVAVNRLREAGRAAVIVDVGSAITVDLVSADGAFLGGAILPGIAMAARAMHEFTDLLPLVDVDDLAAPPPALGTATVPAMQSGLFWGTVGAIRQLVEQLGRAVGVKGDSLIFADHSFAAVPAKIGTVPTEQPQVFLTGGAGVAVAELLGLDARYVPNLTLSGIVLSAM